MNMGLDCAKGEYVGILESDDFAETDMFESLYEMAKGADVDVVKTDFFYHVTDSDPKFDDLACNMADCYCDEPLLRTISTNSVARSMFNSHLKSELLPCAQLASPTRLLPSAAATRSNC